MKHSVIKECLKKYSNQEYHKKLLNFIIFNSIIMMYLSYVLAWFGRVDIAEELSKTIVTAVIGVVIPYLITKTVENISKYGSRLNNTSLENNSNNFNEK